MYRQPWESLKRATIHTPDDFMVYLKSILPNLDESDIIQLRRKHRQKLWLQKVCDFIWVCMQKDIEYWRPQINILWPSIKQIMDEQRLEDALMQLKI
mgnify:CR=1 FL=1